MDIQESLLKFTKDIPDNVTLVAVSKTKPIESILEAYKTGQRDFGENKVQELQQKHPKLPSDIRWHMIGHLQTNKVKYIGHFVHMIHAVDSLKLLLEINKQAKKANRKINVLLQFHIANEESKFGFTMQRFKEEIDIGNLIQLENIVFRGVMGMATYTNDTEIIRNEFRVLKEIFTKLHSEYFTHDTFDVISMGMSQDYKIAVEEGSTMVRIGSSIFGERNYKK